MVTRGGHLPKAGMKAAIKARGKAGSDQIGPVCVFDLAEKLGVTVRFTDINMEGMYDRLPKPRIHLSSLRPPPRRVFTCAHELGHHEFGHGSTIDEMKEESESAWRESPNELLVNSFSGIHVRCRPSACAGRSPARLHYSDGRRDADVRGRLQFRRGLRDIVSHLAMASAR